MDRPFKKPWIHKADGSASWIDAVGPQKKARPRFAQDDPPNRLMLVCGDLELRRSLHRTLNEAGFELVAAPTGLQALKALAVDQFRAIVLEYTTPLKPSDLDCRKSRTLEAITDKAPLLPLVLTRAPETELSYAASLMADIILTHPVGPSDLIDAIETLLTETLRERAFRKSGHVAVLR